MMDSISDYWLATVLILMSAMLHACVNTLVKISGDGLIMRGCMNAIACTFAMPLLVFVPLPDPGLWPLLLISVLVHALYPFFLVAAYRHGDLSTAFPLIRGSVPLLATVIAIVALGQYPGMVSLCGIVLVSIAIVVLAQSGAPPDKPANWRGTIYALLTGLIIAIYTVIDAAGLRLAPSAFAYIVWLFVLDGAFVALLVLAARRGAVVPFITRNWKSTMIAGTLGTLTYGLALFAFSLGPIAEIAALRETSILFAAMIGTLMLKEAFGMRRIVAAAIAVLGVMLAHTGQSL